MKIYIKEHMVKTTYLQDGDFETPLYSFIELCEALQETDGFFTAININDNKTVAYLRDKGFLSQKASGGFYLKLSATTNFKIYLEELQSNEQ